MLSTLAALASPASDTQRLSAIDLAIVALYLVGITLFGLRFRNKGGAAKADRSLKSYFLADNTIPWWAIALSIVSAETSTLTIISIPGVAFAGDFGFLQVVIGYMLGRIAVAGLFLPRYFAGEMLTAYQLIDRRFGPVLHKVTAGLFLITRAAAEGVRVFAVSIVVGIAIGTRDVLSIAIISALTLLYTFEGGMAAVVWTDVVQMAIYVGGTVVAILTLGSHVTGGWSTIHAVAGAAGKFHMLNFALDLTQSYTFWAGVLGGTFLTMASHGTDQLMVQRLLAARNLRESRLALLSSGVVIFLQFTLFLLIGVGLYVFYGQHPAVFSSNDRIFPTFIVRELPVGIAGLLVAAILAAAMSNLSAALNSLSSTTVVDFYMRLRPAADDRERNLISKSSTVLWAIVLFAIAAATAAVGGKGHVVEMGLSIASVAYGCLLGVFLLGTLTRYATQYGATVGMVCGFILNYWLWQGVFPVHLGPVTIPHVAWTWYVLIGALVTFAIGSLASLVLRDGRKPITAAILFLVFILSAAKDLGGLRAVAQTPSAPSTSIVPIGEALKGKPWNGKMVDESDLRRPNRPGFETVDSLIADAITAHKLPGAVVVIGHNGQVVYQHAYGNRKLADEPGLDGQPSPAEPMTEGTIFDMASLTKCLATATAVMQLYEQGKVDFDAPIQQYLPEFNAGNDPQRAKVTVRLLLTHFSGEAPDVSLKAPWGLAAPDRAEGLRLAYTTPLTGTPGAKFVYSDINFILLGALIERLSGEREDAYVQAHVFGPLGMVDTRYLPFDKVCGLHTFIGAAVASAPRPSGDLLVACQPDDWNTGLLERIAPTAHDDEAKANPATNPDFDRLLRGTVHDPTTRRMGSVAGHAGVFSTAHDMSLYASALLEKLLHNTGPFPLKQSTLQLMTSPEQPGHSAQQLVAAREAALHNGPSATDPLLGAAYPAVKDQSLRGFGWDIDTAYSKPRGNVFAVGSFGHTGFTGTSLWMDPASDTFVILLANAVHPRGGAPITPLRGAVATAAALALRARNDSATWYHRPTLEDHMAQKRDVTASPAFIDYVRGDDPGAPSSRPASSGAKVGAPAASTGITTLTGIDVLEATHFTALTASAKTHANRLRLGLLTNQAGIDAQRRRTVDILAADAPKAVPGLQLTTLFSPEHGIFGKQDTTRISAETDPATGLAVTSLYGPKDADKRPTHEQLKDLDAVVIDLQDAGVHFWTYESVTGYFLEAAARERSEFDHHLEIILLDRPNLIGGVAVQGPVSDVGTESYVNYMPLPVRHGMTLGELARYIVGEKHLSTTLTVIPMQNWTRAEYFDQTGLPWVNPSPNLRSITAATVYPGVSLSETTNISVGRGTANPIEIIAAGKPSKDPKTGEERAAWFRGADVAAALNARHIPGVTFTAGTLPVIEDANHYPFHGQTIEAVHVTLTDRQQLDSPEMGVEVLSALHQLYPTQFQVEKAMRLLCNRATIDAIARGDDPRAIAASWQPALDAFKARRAKYLLY